MSVLHRIQAYNLTREPERLELKYAVMRRNAFSFLRGTSHLFHEDWPAEPLLDRAPLAWICGDLHLENFGSYKGDNRLTYFDLNDFDEATLAPCTRDLARFVTSVLVAARGLKLKERDGTTLAKRFLSSYREALAEGKARWVERQTAEGMVRALLREARYLTRKRLLDMRTKVVGKSRRIRLGKRALPVSAADRKKVERIIEKLASGESNPAFYTPVDVARRVAGTASLGLERYVLLVEGRGAPDKLAILDLKQAIPPSLPTSATSSRVVWSSEAQRVVSIQQWVQAVPPALLHPVRAGTRSYVLRELQPTQDRLSLEAWDRTLRQLEGVMVTMGQVVAWSHLRSGGRQGSANADQWIAFAEEKAWEAAILEFAMGYGRHVERDWAEFTEGAEGRGPRAG
jgi:uncharacterized protein (DUF2252 family)